MASEDRLELGSFFTDVSVYFLRDKGWFAIHKCA